MSHVKTVRTCCAASAGVFSGPVSNFGNDNTPLLQGGTGFARLVMISNLRGQTMPATIRVSPKYLLNLKKVGT